MRYEAMGKARRQRLNIPQPVGGVNTATEAEFIDDDELAASCNLMIDHGTLRTREAVKAIGEGAYVTQAGAYTHIDGLFTKPIEVDGKMCVVSVLGRNDTTIDGAGLMDILSVDGNSRQTYAIRNIRNENGICRAAAISTYADKVLMYVGGNMYKALQGELKKIGDDELYAPLVMINGRSAVGENKAANGVMYEGLNLLTMKYYRAGYTPSTGEEKEFENYYPPIKMTGFWGETPASITVDILYADGDVSLTLENKQRKTTFKLGNTEYTLNVENDGTVVIQPALPISDVANTVTITYKETGASSLPDVSLATWFGGTANKRGGTRLFLADTDHAKLLWSGVNNPFYFPENNYMIVGDTSQKITALEKQSDMLVIFKEREIFYTTYVQGEIDAEAVADGVNVDVNVVQAYFPLTQLSPQIGCRCPKSIALCRDRLVWMDEDARIYTLVVSGQYSERNVREIGQKIRPWLLENTTEEQRRNASAIDHNGKYRLLIGNVMAEFDYNDSGFVNVSGYSSGERAARNIAWMTHRYNFDPNTVQTLVSDGADKALIISTVTQANTTARTLYHFDEDEDDDKDRYLTMAEDGTFSDRMEDIPVSLTTKTYEFGDPAAFKRIHALYPMLQTEGAELSFVTDGEEPPYGKRYQSADTFAHLVMPGISRCRTFALKLNAIGKLCLKGLRMEYSLFGNVK